MIESYDDPIDPALEIFQRLCMILDSCEKRADATCSPDVFSGGFKFSDEAPHDFEKLGDQLPPFVDLLRCLWGYRASVATGKPRSDLAHYWDAAKVRAPRWPGFAVERSSEKMKCHVDAAERQTMEFIKEMDRLDRTLEKTRVRA
jgi:hypothetical protein